MLSGAIIHLQRQASKVFKPTTTIFRTMSSQLPSTLTGPPVCSLVPPKKCQFGEEFVSVPLLESFKVTDSSSVFRFGLPDSSKPLNLSTCACILAQATIDGEGVVRPYTPISTNANVGFFDLLIKNYGEKAKMSRHMHEMKAGDKINFKHIDFNVKIQAEEFLELDEILMMVGGTGITPMIQALHAVLGSEGKKPKVTMLYGSRVSTDILGKECLHTWAKEYPEQFQLFDVLSHEPEDSSWDGPRGYINKEMIDKNFPAASTDKKIKVFVCGPPPMYEAFCGPRDEKEKITGMLGDLGYSPEQVVKF